MITQTLSSPLLDSGATKTLFRQSDINILKNVQNTSRFHMELPSKEVIVSESAGLFQLSPNLPPILAHIFPDNVLQRSLVSVSVLVNLGYTATFTKFGCTIRFNEDILMTNPKFPFENYGLSLSIIIILKRISIILLIGWYDTIIKQLM